MINLSRVLRFEGILLGMLIIALFSDIVCVQASIKGNVPIKSLSISEKYDLGITEIITEEEISFHRNIVVPRTWDQLLLNMSVQNFGDSIENVFLQVKTNGNLSEDTFSSLLDVGLVEAISYQFEIPQTLLLALNYTKQTEIILDILVIIDFGLVWHSPNVNFFINGAELIGIDLSQPYVNENLPLFNVHHRYQIQPAKFSILEKDLLASPILFVRIPSEMQLDCMFLVTLEGIGINYVTINDFSFYSSKGSQATNFNLSIKETSETQGLPLKVVVTPDYEEVLELTPVLLSIYAFGVLHSPPTSTFDDVLGSHPIPAWLMFLILLVCLIGVPYYCVYREHLEDKDKNPLTPNQKLKFE
ncbi:MAG: hypothetical protein JSV04_14700 [Candidatus Heimdallarchaeota archaeon]|nr:MAG: hypothetical protein JSV04_14700 [Candidatus Heimdallarchaeota archaeon]